MFDCSRWNLNGLWGGALDDKDEVIIAAFFCSVRTMEQSEQESGGLKCLSLYEARAGYCPDMILIFHS